jgi:hypothetical protein
VAHILLPLLKYAQPKDNNDSTGKQYSLVVFEYMATTLHMHMQPWVLGAAIY